MESGMRLNRAIMPQCSSYERPCESGLRVNMRSRGSPRSSHGYDSRGLKLVSYEMGLGWHIEFCQSHQLHPDGALLS